MKKKKFISIIWGYHKQIFSFEKEQNYHMMPLQVMKDEGYDCEIFAIDSQVDIENDPNFISGVNVKYYKNIFGYLCYLIKNRNNTIYSNSLTIKTLIVGIFGKKTIFYPHSYHFGNNIFKNNIIKFFYKFFTKIRTNNQDEFLKIENIKKGLAIICPLSISKNFLSTIDGTRKNGIWIGNLTEIKNPEFLLDTADILKEKNIEFKFNIIGEDRYNRGGLSFLKLIKDRNLYEYFNLKGVLSHTKIKKELANSKIYINTSISEGQCLAVYEASLSGNFLCLQNILSFPSVFKDNALYHNSAYELAQNIIYLLENGNKYLYKNHNNQKMILNNYSFINLKKEMKNMFLT